MALCAMSTSHNELVFFDLETAGPNPKRHPIIQIAAIAIDGTTFANRESLELKIRFDERRATKYALRKNSYSRRTWQEHAVNEVEAAMRFADFLKRHATYSEVSRNGVAYRLAQLVAHNAAFDGPFLHAWFERYGMFCPARRQVLCTLQRCLSYFLDNPHLTWPRNFRLATLCQYFGVAFAAADAHDALGDARATAALYHALALQHGTTHYPKSMQ